MNDRQKADILYETVMDILGSYYYDIQAEGYYLNGVVNHFDRTQDYLATNVPMDWRYWIEDELEWLNKHDRKPWFDEYEASLIAVSML